MKKMPEVFVPGVYVYDLQDVCTAFNDVYADCDLRDPYVVSQMADDIRMMGKIRFADCEHSDLKIDVFRSVAKCVQKIKDKYDPVHAKRFAEISDLGKGEIFDRNVKHMCDMFLCGDFSIAVSLDGIAESLAEKSGEADAFHDFLDQKNDQFVREEYNNAEKPLDDNVIRHNILSEEGYPDDYPDEKLPAYLAAKVEGHSYHDEKTGARIPEDNNAELREMLDAYRYKVQMLRQSDRSHLDMHPDFGTYDEACGFIIDQRNKILESDMNDGSTTVFKDIDGKLVADTSFPGKTHENDVHYEFVLIDGYGTSMNITWDSAERTVEQFSHLGLE